MRLDYFSELGERIEARWRAKGYADSALPPIAEAELRKRPPHEHVSPWKLAQLGRDPQRMPQQGSAGFGQPPLAVWGSERMYIELLYWLDSTTAIHQHSFSGAFAVLEGSSLHTQYRFKPNLKASDDLHIGKLTWVSSEFLPRGSIHQIHSGPQFVHALYHLDHPSVSVVVRNYHDEGSPPQLGYLPPGIGVDHSLVDPRLERALELYRMLVDLGRLAEAEQIVRGIIKHSDLLSVYLVMAAIGETAAERDIAKRVHVNARKLYGEVIDTISDALEHQDEQRRFTALRGRIIDPDLRYFLALLLVVPTPTALRRLIAARAPRKDVVATVMRWLTALADTDAFKVRLQASQLQVIEFMMRGHTLPQITKALGRENRDAIGTWHQQVKSSPYLVRLIAAARAS